MKNLLDLFNAIVAGKTVIQLIEEKTETEIGIIGEAVLRLAVTLGIDPINPDNIVEGIEYVPKIQKFTTIVNVKSHLRESSINESCEKGKIDVAWKSQSYNICSSKFGKKKIKSLDELDITQMQSEIYAQKVTHNGKLIVEEPVDYYVLVRNKEDLLILNKNRAHVARTLLPLKNVLDIHHLDTICFKIQEITDGYENPIDGFITKKRKIKSRFHQELICMKAKKALKDTDKVLICAIPRSGKTIIGAILCVGYSKILVLTTRPSETIKAWKNIFENSREFENYNVKYIDDSVEIDNIKENTVIIASTQYFKYDDRYKKRGMKFDIVIVDEIHEGGCTYKSKEIMKNNSGEETKFVLMTATYNKPIINFNIDIKYCFFWDLEDVRLMKNWGHASEIRLQEKYGNEVRDVIDKFNKKRWNIDNIYHTFPEPYFLTTAMHEKYYSKLIHLMENPSNIYGFSMRSLLMTTKDGKNFQHPKAVDKFLELFSGSNLEEDFPDGDLSILSRIERIQMKNNHSREKSFLTMKWFIPYGIGQKVEDVKNCLIKHINKNDVLSDYGIMVLNAGDVNISETVSDEIAKSKRSKKIGLIILTGDVGSLGVSIPEVDVTVLMHDFKSFDKTFQQMFRCLTEDYKNGKRTGIIVDFDVWRVLNTINAYAIEQCGKTFKNTTEKIKWCISNLIKIDSDLWECRDQIENPETQESVIESLTTQWTKMMESVGHNLVELSRQFSDIGEDQQILNSIINNLDSLSSSDREQKKMEDGISVHSDEKASSTESSDEKKTKNINLNELLTRIIPEIALWTGTKLSMLDAFVETWENPMLRSAINEYLSFKTKLSKNDIFRSIICIMKKQIKNLTFAEEVFDSIRIHMRELIDDPIKINKYLCETLRPDEFQKKKNGEVFTSPDLIRYKFSKLEINTPTIWSDPHRKFLDPSSGIGNYPIIAYEKLMSGLETKIPNYQERKKHIIENMLYMCELTEKNVETSRKLFDPRGIYKLNLFKGSFFDLDTNKEWGVEKFDIVMGNPPYQQDKASGDNKLYITFTTRSIELLKEDGVLTFITPRNILPYLLLSGKNRFKFDKLYNIKYLSIETCNKYFKGVGSTFLWFILEKSDYKGETHVEYMNNDVISYDVIKLTHGLNIPKTLSPIDLKIISKLISLDNSYEFEEFSFKGSSRRIRKNHIENNTVSQTPTETNKFPIIDTINKTNPFPGKVYFYKSQDDSVHIPKLVISKKGYLEPTIDSSGKYSYSDNFKFITGNNLDGILILLKSKIIDYMIKQFSMNGFDRTSIISIIRKVNITNESKIEDIYKLYDLTEEEIKRISEFN
jgi:hypothetical protein